MLNNYYVIAAILICAFVTLALRAIPFLLFSGNRKTPKLISYLGDVLPYAIMGMLVVYCLRDISFLSLEGFLPQIIAGALASILFVWKRNALISIVLSTVCYMLLVQLVF